jgi:hypothetical protein
MQVPIKNFLPSKFSMKATKRGPVGGERERRIFLCVVIYNVKCDIALGFWHSGMGCKILWAKRNRC